MSRLIDAGKLLDALIKHREQYCATALDSAAPEVAEYEYGYKVGYNRGLLAAEQKLNELLKVEDNAGRPQRDPYTSPVHTY